ncbi:MAG: hypothetical protein WCL29_08100, partial [Pseudomonadota bacterium]
MRHGSIPSIQLTKLFHVAASAIFAGFVLLALPAAAKQALGEGCSPIKHCGDGLSCQPVIQKCYH